MKVEILLSEKESYLVHDISRESKKYLDSDILDVITDYTEEECLIIIRVKYDDGPIQTNIVHTTDPELNVDYEFLYDHIELPNYVWVNEKGECAICSERKEQNL